MSELPACKHSVSRFERRQHPQHRNKLCFRNPFRIGCLELAVFPWVWGNGWLLGSLTSLQKPTEIQ